MLKPKDIKSLLEYVVNGGDLESLLNNLLIQWGPRNRRMLSPDFLPPRLVENNQDTIDQVHFRTVAAVDGTRYSPAQLVDSGEVFGRINYRLGNSDLARQIAGPDYDGIVRYLKQNLSMQAAAKVIGVFDSFIIQGLVEHDELANWEAIVFNKITRRGDNAYYDYEDGPDLSGHRVEAGGDWSDPAYDPWGGDILPRIRLLVRLGFAREGIRIVTSDENLQTLAENPFTMRRALNVATYGGQTPEEAQGTLTGTDLDRVFRKLKVQPPIAHDLRVQTKTGEVRAYPSDHMTFIASTGRTEEVVTGADTANGQPGVRQVENTLGFTGIGKANGQDAPGRRSALRSFTNQKDARIEMEGWQSTGPVILEPTAIADIGGIENGT